MQLPLRAAYNVHKQNGIQVYDVTGARVDGRWAEGAPSDDRQISCVIQPITDKTARLLPQGMKMGGQLVMQTDFPIYIRDVNQPIQTFVRYMGDVWRAWAVNSVADKNGGIVRFILERYVAP